MAASGGAATRSDAVKLHRPSTEQVFSARSESSGVGVRCSSDATVEGGGLFPHALQRATWPGVTPAPGFDN